MLFIHIEAKLGLIYILGLIPVFQCVKSEVKDKVVKYLVHYNGWNKRFA